MMSLSEYYKYLDRELGDLLREAKEWREKIALVKLKYEEEIAHVDLKISEVDTLKKQKCILSIVDEQMYRFINIEDEKMYRFIRSVAEKEFKFPTEKKEGEVVDKKILEERNPKIESIIKGIQSILEECQFEIQVDFVPSFDIIYEEEEIEKFKNFVKDETEEGFEEAEMPSILIGVASIFIGMALVSLFH